MKMNKNEYIKISHGKGLPSRCPILGFCQRRAITIYLFNKYSKEYPSKNIVEALIAEGEISSEYLDNEIQMIGEVPEIINAETYGHFINTCPEVNLFDKLNALSLFKGTATTEGTWDIELKTKFKIIEEKHYAECLEFSKHLYDNKISPQSNKKYSKTTDCYTYLMIDLNSGHHKIGISQTPEYREKTLQSENPKIVTVCSRKFMNRKLALDFENELHKRYKHKNIRGEWFDLNPFEIEEIKGLLTN
jgi:hypothetical protein